MKNYFSEAWIWLPSLQNESWLTTASVRSVRLQRSLRSTEVRSLVHTRSRPLVAVEHNCSRSKLQLEHQREAFSCKPSFGGEFRSQFLRHKIDGDYLYVAQKP